MTKNIKKYLPWIILALIVISLSVWFILSKRITQEQLSTYQSQINDAKTHLEAKQFSSAIDKYYKATETLPTRVEAYEGILDILIMKNRVDEVTEVIEKSAKALSSYDKSILYKKLGDAYLESGEYSMAFESYDNGLILGVKNMSLELAFGKSMLKIGNINDAKRQFGKQGYEGEEAMEADLLLAYIYSLDDTSEAKKILENVEATGKMQVYYDEFLDVLNSLNDDTKYNGAKLARVYINNGYPYLAISVLEPLKENILEYLEGMYFLGRAYMETGQYEKAIETLDGALTLGGLETEIFWSKARAYYLSDDFDNSTKTYDSSIGYMGETINNEIVEEYVNLLLENNQPLKASEVLKQLLLVSPKEPLLNLLSVEVYVGLNEQPKIDYYLSQLEGIELTDSEKTQYLEMKIGNLYKKEEDITEYMEELLKMDQYNPYYYLFLSKNYIKEEETELAVQSLEKALEYDMEYRVTEEASILLSSLR